MEPKIASWKDKLLFTPGPLTTSRTVKLAMLRDLGSRDYEFVHLIQEIREALLALGNVQKGEYEAIIMQGSGTFSLEAVISSVVPPEGCLLVIVNGAYGRRLLKIAEKHKIKTIARVFEESEAPEIDRIQAALMAHSDITHVGVIHCETTTGILNSINEIGRLVKNAQKEYIVDSMSAFGAIPTDLKAGHIDYLISSANKNIEGVPGFGFVLARKAALLQCKDHSRTLSLDLYDQWEGLEKNGQFRFTPPTHTLLAFRQALRELEKEGGVAARAKRYAENKRILSAGMKKLGFKEYIHPDLQSYIITSFHYPDHKYFNFEVFYEKLNTNGMVIYPGKTSNADCFRIGTIGRIFPADIYSLLDCLERILDEMDIRLSES